MSNSITNLIASIRHNGIQKVNLYTCTIFQSGGVNFNLDTYLLDLTLPGPKYQFYSNTYWRGNWEYKQPVGIKFEDNLIMVVIVPQKEVTRDNNVFSFLNSNRSKFSYPANGSGSFYWKGPSSNDYSGYGIDIYPIDNKGEKQKPYKYRNCFVEKILPFKFSAEADPPYQTMSIVWTVGAEVNRL
jgi:hypothetical protein